MLLRYTPLLFVACLVWGISGCGNTVQTEPSGMTMPTTVAAGVAALEDYHKAIKTAFTSGTPDDAHDALHNVGDLLEHLKGLIQSADLPQDVKETMESARAEINDSFLKIDESLHHGGDGEYEAVSEKLQNAMDSIRSALPDGQEAP